jgi:SAM-dependent methyltransferase
MSSPYGSERPKKYATGVFWMRDTTTPGRKKNYERYSALDAQAYEKKTLMSVLFAAENARVIGEIVGKITKKRVLELGCGTGRYTRLYHQRNEVTCIDINPHLFAVRGVQIIGGDATRLDLLLDKKEKFDFILSFWMTEYLNQAEVLQTLRQSKGYLTEEGKIIFTFVSKGVWGRLYVLGSKLKGIDKYNYSLRSLRKLSSTLGLAIEQAIPIKRFGCELGKVLSFIPTEHVTPS